MYRVFHVLFQAGFSSLNKLTRCVVVTSGTLSPLGTFASELGAEFPVRVEANHVVSSEQVLVRSVGSGPTGKPLCVT